MDGRRDPLSNTQFQDDEDDEHQVVETDPTGRFERYAECLGKGAYKEVFKAFDSEEGIEVAWNQLRIDHFMRKEAQRILQEIQILECLKHENIINLHHAWVAKGKDGKDKICFITELMTSGTLKSYIRKTKGPVKPKVLKSWCRQVLSGLHYLHSREPPIIHRDLKCENIFINGNNGQAKIGDLGLAVVKHREHASSVLGTPEYMAPELYDEKYDERVDIYAFGMMVLEIVTKDYPYSECTNQAQIYKKVTSGIKPSALQRVPDEDTRRFIECCIQFNPLQRPIAAELLRHPFLTMLTAASTTSLSEGPDTRETMGGAYWEHRGSVASDNSGQEETMEPREPGDSGISTWHSNLSSQLSIPAEPVKVDAENHTFEILCRHLPQASISAPPVPSVSQICTVQVVEKVSDDEVIIKMMYAAVSRRPSQEITFPFSLQEDTAKSVVEEMVREGIIADADENVAREQLAYAVEGLKRRGVSAGSGGYPTLSPGGYPGLGYATFPRYNEQRGLDSGRLSTLPRPTSGAELPLHRVSPLHSRETSPIPPLAHSGTLTPVRRASNESVGSTMSQEVRRRRPSGSSVLTAGSSGEVTGSRPGTPGESMSLIPEARGWTTVPTHTGFGMLPLQQGALPTPPITNPDFQRRLLEMQEKNLAGFGLNMMVRPAPATMMHPPVAIPPAGYMLRQSPPPVGISPGTHQPMHPPQQQMSAPMGYHQAWGMPTSEAGSTSASSCSSTTSSSSSTGMILAPSGGICDDNVRNRGGSGGSVNLMD